MKNIFFFFFKIFCVISSAQRFLDCHNETGSLSIYMHIYRSLLENEMFEESSLLQCDIVPSCE
jgi:hypothetical protein